MFDVVQNLYFHLQTALTNLISEYLVNIVQNKRLGKNRGMITETRELISLTVW